tara:strand:- start:51165 stop:51329 length:165 start_codon:yes stop_codon:yes gene_type:complete
LKHVKDSSQSREQSEFELKASVAVGWAAKIRPEKFVRASAWEIDLYSQRMLTLQ